MSESASHPSNARTLLFVVSLCVICGLVLALMATLLAAPQERAREVDRAKQILRAARIYTVEGNFQLRTAEGLYEPAVWDAKEEKLISTKKPIPAPASAIMAIMQKQILPRLTDATGNLYTFEEVGINREEYLRKHEKEGYALLDYKLLYLILPNGAETEEGSVEGYILPINGFGLWGPIYGYLALEANADQVIGTTWDAPAETPGLGAIIQDPKWQAQFEGKQIFLPSADQQTHFATAPLGLQVVKGKVSNVYGNSPRAQTAVDGITGATITGDGVTEAYKRDLRAYRPFLLRAHKRFVEGEEGKPQEGEPIHE